MADLNTRTPMPLRDAEERRHHFHEVALGYTREDAIREATRCLQCKKPLCVEGCPVNIRIPDFIARLKEDDVEGAYAVIRESSSLPAICGRVCPQENQCEKKCVRALKGESVAIGRLERYAADMHNVNLHNAGKNETSAQTPAKEFAHRAAVIGSGPAGLACAGELIRRGIGVTVFEAFHRPGGVLVYGIPEFRLPKAIVREECRGLEEAGVEFRTNTVIGRTLEISELTQMGYEAVFIGTGAGLPQFQGIPGEMLKGVYSANEYLTRVNLMGAWKREADTPIQRGGRVAVIGGGNVAMDAARTAVRLGAEKVMILYRRSMQELPARAEEVEHAQEEGVEFLLLTNPVEILGYENPDNPRDVRNGCVKGIRCLRMELGEPDERGRRSPIPIPGSEFEMDLDTVVVAIGTRPNPLLKTATPELETTSRGGIVVTEEGETSIPMVFAGGDAVTGAATVISAMGAGKAAAEVIADRLLKK